MDTEMIKYLSCQKVKGSCEEIFLQKNYWRNFFKEKIKKNNHEGAISMSSIIMIV